MKKKILFSIVLFIFVFFLMTILGEVYFRVKFGNKNIINAYTPVLYTHRGQRISTIDGNLKLRLAPFTVYKNFPSQHNLIFNINSRGFRSPEDTEHNSKSKIILLGGSAAFGQGSISDQETISYIMDKKLD